MRVDLAGALAASYLAGEWSQPGLVESGATVVGRRPRWLHALARQTLALYPRPPHDRPRELAALLATTPAAAKAGQTGPALRVVSETRMTSNRWRLPVLDDLDDVGRLLGLTDGELAWFADTRLLARSTTTTRLQHYRVSHRVSASGAVRVLEAPKHRLKTVQRRLLDEVAHLVPVHPAARGFRPGGSVHSYAAPHASQPVVLRLDLESFFASVTAARVHGTWRAVGYPEPVAHCLTGLVTCVLPRSAWRTVPRPASATLLDAHWRLGRRLAAPHLPQGAPTSPALANLTAHRLDTRLTALAASWGGRYTRYADDLAFSGGRGWRDGAIRLVATIGDIVRDEGFAINARKTAVMSSTGRQVLGGLVVNERPRVTRADVDRLRAVLHNCRRHGPSVENREDHPAFREHLRGRIGWVGEHDPDREARLLATFDQIDWSR